LNPGIAFLGGSAGPDYGRLLSRLRWERAFPGAEAVEVSPEQAAEGALAGRETWILVREESALPRVSSRLPRPGAGHVLVCTRAGLGGSPVHTLREWESIAPERLQAGPADGEVPALCFRTADFPPLPGETLGMFLERLSGEKVEKERDPEFLAFSFPDPSESERPEITALVPPGCRRLLDVGSGAGGSAAALRRRFPVLQVTALEREERSASSARGKLDRVLAGDALASLRALAGAGETFDAFLFADVLEHLADPAAALSAGRALAEPRATLIASVPNAGHLSLVRDLVLGRFDPIPAGLADAGHLRWFTRGWLREILEETGWQVSRIAACPGAPAPEREEFLARLSRWPDLDTESLATYQWIAVAHPAE
jgi:SAM-dependent methyltransferase